MIKLSNVQGKSFYLTHGRDRMLIGAYAKKKYVIMTSHVKLQTSNLLY